MDAPEPCAAPPGPAPLRRITVLYDADCPLCRRVGSWVSGQPAYIPVDLVPAGSPRARNRFPGLDHEATLRVITVVGDGGQVWTGPHAWIVVLWAMRGHRGRAYALATPAGLPLAWGAVMAAARVRAVTRAVAGPAPAEAYDPYARVCDDRCRPGGG